MHSKPIGTGIDLANWCEYEGHAIILHIDPDDGGGGISETSALTQLIARRSLAYMKLLIMQFSPASCYSIALSLYILLSTVFKRPQSMFFLEHQKRGSPLISNFTHSITADDNAAEATSV
jgi:hypothetical protein